MAYYGETQRSVKEVKKELWVCNNCGSDQIEKRGWVDYNTNEFLEEDSDSTDVYCSKCHDFTDTILESDYEDLDDNEEDDE